MTKNLSICPAPWIAAAVKPFGEVIPCCSFSPDENFILESRVDTDFLNSNAWQDIRNKMSNGIPVIGCETCYRKEQLGIKSSRETLIDFFGESKTVNLEFLEIGFSNVCNLACVGCDYTYSSKWGAELKKHNLINESNIIKSNNIDDIIKNYNLKNLKVLKVLGGEPLLEQAKFIKILEKTNLNNLTVTFTTNGTVFPNNHLKSLLEKCQAVHLYISIDGESTVNEWVRWPIKHSVLKNNIKKYVEWKSTLTNIFLISHTVINIYNIWTLNFFINELNKKYPDWIFDFGWVESPSWQSISNIHESFKLKLEENLIQWNRNIKINFLQERNPFLDSIKYLNKESESSWNEFKEKSLTLAEQRNLNLFKMVPSLKNKF
jgi:organic radical activating enzyme